MHQVNTQTIRVNITVPKHLWEELGKEVPERGKSTFVALAVQERLQKSKRMKAFRELAKLPPTFTHIPDGAEYIHTQRREEDKKRSEKLGV